MKRLGDKASTFSLRDLNGAAHTSNDLVRNGKAITAFFKVNCPTCQYTFPFLERLHRQLPGVPIFGISQNSLADTKDFASTFGISLPILLDEDDYKVSRAFAITTVPTIFVLDSDHKITSVTEGWVKDEFQALAESLVAPAVPISVFKAGESVQQFKAG